MKKALLKLFFFSIFILFNFPTGRTNSNFSSRKTVDNNTVSTTCWTLPSVPQLVYPTNPTFAGAGSPWDQNPYMDWDNSTTSCPLSTAITYQYQACADSACSNVIYTSPSWLTDSQIPAPGTPNGTYYWRVRAQDSLGNTSDFSLTWKLVVDRASPLVPSLSITGSYIKSVEEKINPANWTVAGQVSSMSTDTITGPNTTIDSLSGSMFRIGVPDDPGNYVWDNRLMQSFDTGAKSLSLKYNFFSRDYSPFDQPGFFIRLNGQEIFKQNNLSSDEITAKSTGWQDFYYDLSSQDNSQTNLAIYAGNTIDKISQSWAYVDQVTTYFVSAPLHATYSFSSADSDINRYEYSLDGGSTWTPVYPGNTFSLPAGNVNLAYRSIDNADNHSPIATVKIIVDASPPADITNFTASTDTSTQITLNWTASGNDGSVGRASRYELKYSLSADLSNPIFINLPSPQNSGVNESAVINGLNPGTHYYFSLKAADEAPNWSNPVSADASTPADADPVHFGDIVINEIMWIEGLNPEQWIELRNLTNRDIDMSGLTLKLDSSTIVSLTGATIPAGGYYLISTKNNTNSNIKDSINIDLPNQVFDLPRTPVLDLELDYGPTPIDFAWNNINPVAEGIVEPAKYYSLERISGPGEGDEPLSWYTCIDTASSADFFDTIPAVDFRGTPKAANRSENEPLAHLQSVSRPTSTPILTPTPIPATSVNLSSVNADNKITFTVSNITNSFNYEVIYTNSIGEQGFAGKILSTDIIDNKIIREFYLGSCSTGNTCTPDTDIGSTATVILTGETVNINQTFTIH